MSFLDKLFAKETKKKVSEVADETIKKGKVIGKKVVAKGKVAAKVVKEKTEVAKQKILIEKTKLAIGNEVVKKGLPIAKNDPTIKPLLDKVKELENKDKKSSKKK